MAERFEAGRARRLPDCDRKRWSLRPHRPNRYPRLLSRRCRAPSHRWAGSALPPVAILAEALRAQPEGEAEAEAVELKDSAEGEGEEWLTSKSVAVVAGARRSPETLEAHSPLRVEVRQGKGIAHLLVAAVVVVARWGRRALASPSRATSSGGSSKAVVARLEIESPAAAECLEAEPGATSSPLARRKYPGHSPCHPSMLSLYCNQFQRRRRLSLSAAEEMLPERCATSRPPGMLASRTSNRDFDAVNIPCLGEIGESLGRKSSPSWHLGNHLDS